MPPPSIPKRVVMTGLDPVTQGTCRSRELFRLCPTARHQKSNAFIGLRLRHFPWVTGSSPVMTKILFGAVKLNRTAVGLRPARLNCGALCMPTPHCEMALPWEKITACIRGNRSKFQSVLHAILVSMPHSRVVEISYSRKLAKTSNTDSIKRGIPNA